MSQIGMGSSSNDGVASVAMKQPIGSETEESILAHFVELRKQKDDNLTALAGIFSSSSSESNMTTTDGETTQGGMTTSMGEESDANVFELENFEQLL